MYLGIKQVSTTEDYQLDLIFDNNDCRRFDVKPLLTIGRFAELTEIELFKTVRISFDTIEWNNGLDLDPEYLYEKSYSLCRTEPRLLSPAFAASPSLTGVDNTLLLPA